MERRTFLAGAGPSAALLTPWLATALHAPETGGIRDVRSFGAVGDNVHDDGPAIQKAIDADPRGGTVFFPQGVYRVEAPIMVRSTTVLLGHGRHTALSATTTGDAIIIARRVKQVFLEGLYLNAGGKARHGIIVDHCDDIRIRQCWVTAMGGCGLVVIGTGPMVMDSIFELSGLHGISVTETNSGIPLQIIGCSLYANGGDGIHFETNANQSMVVANEILSNKGAGIRIMDRSQMLSVSSNAILNSGTVGIHITNSLLTGLSNNLISESAQHAILIEGGSDQTVLMANRCVSNGKSDPDRFATLGVRGSRDVTVIGNVFGGVVSPKVSQIDSDVASHVNASANVMPAVAKP